MTVAWPATLYFFSILQSACAITFSTLVPTGTHNEASEPPDPTPGLQLNRRESSAAMETLSTILTDTPAVCGWFDTSINTNDLNTYACENDHSCVYHKSNTAFPGMAGCCSSDDCGFSSTCYHSAKVAASPSLLSGNTAFALFCTESSAAECATYTWVNADLTDFQCDSTAHLDNIYTKGTWGGTADGTILLATQYVITTDDGFLSAYSASYDVSTSLSKPSRQASATGSKLATTTGAQTTAVSPSNSDSSTSAGTIAGSVVGGVAGASAIGAFAFFLLRKKRKKQGQQDQLVGPEQNGYRSAPNYHYNYHYSQSTWELQGSHPTLGKLSEAGPGNAPEELDSRTPRAELPAPDKRNSRPSDETGAK